VKRAGSDDALRCSFCLKSQDVVDKLISSPSDYPRAYICDECIAVCNSIFEDDKSDLRSSTTHKLPRPLEVKEYLDQDVIGQDGAKKKLLVRNVSVQKAGQLPQPLKAAVEQILGRSIGADEEISIVVVPPQQAAPSEGKAAVIEKLEALLNRRAEKVGDIPEDKINAVVDEAVHHDRHDRG
jgi:hypothetical protein